MDHHDDVIADRPELRDAVLQAWRSVCPEVEFAPHLSWRDVGLDSLRSLEFLLRLERVLGRSISFEQLTADSTAEDLIRTLAASPEDGGEVGGQSLLFVIPGLLGDEPTLAEFRRSLSLQIKTKLLPLPDLDEPTKVLTSLTRTAAHCKAMLEEHQPQGVVRLAGFSFGALTAQEVARQLEEEGRTVEFLGAIDGLFMAPKAFRFLASDRRSSDAEMDDRVRKKRPRPLDDLVFGLLFRIHALDWARRYFNIAARRNDWAWSAERRRWLLGALRYWANRGRRARPCSAPTLLITSNDFEQGASLATWRRLCPNIMEVVAVRADHLALFEGEALKTVCKAIFDAFARQGRA